MAIVYIPDKEYEVLTLKTNGKPKQYVRQLVTTDMKAKGWMK